MSRPGSGGGGPASSRHQPSGELQPKPFAAKAQFQRGFELSQKSGFLFNMAECARLSRPKVEAHALYQRFLREFPGSKHSDAALTQCRSLAAGPCPASPGGTPRAGSSDPAVPDGDFVNDLR